MNVSADGNLNHATCRNHRTSAVLYNWSRLETFLKNNLRKYVNVIQKLYSCKLPYSHMNTTPLYFIENRQYCLFLLTFSLIQVK